MADKTMDLLNKSFVAIATAVVPDKDYVEKYAGIMNMDSKNALELLKSRGGGHLPIEAQKIVALSLLSYLPKKRADRTGTIKTFKAPSLIPRIYMGDQPDLLSRFAECFNYHRFNGYFPQLIMADGGCHALKLIINKTVQWKVQTRSGTDKGDIPDHVNEAMRIILDDRDKWERDRPNYLNRFSRFTLDLTQHLSIFPLKADLERITEFYEAGNMDAVANSLKEETLSIVKSSAAYYEMKGNDNASPLKFPDEIYSLDRKETFFKVMDLSEEDRSVMQEERDP